MTLVQVISSGDFSTITNLLYQMSGISLPESKRAMVAARLADRVRVLGMTSMSEYCALLNSPSGNEEHENMLLALTTNITSFERERKQLDHFDQVLLPELVERARAGGRVRLWSAACSTGEEAFSLAFRVLDACPDANQFDFKILATDIDRRVVSAAKTATYSRTDIEKLPTSFANRFFTSCGASVEMRQVKAEPQKLISFKVLNLLSDWPFEGKFDMIMCRNVAIYFDEKTQLDLWSRLAGRLAKNGILYIGHSESISDFAQLGFRTIGQSTFQRGAAPPGRRSQKQQHVSPLTREQIH